MNSQQQAERQYEYRPQRKTLKLAGILMMIMPIIGVPVLLAGEVEPFTILGIDLNATWSAIAHIGLGILTFLSGGVIFANALRKTPAGAHIRFTADMLIFPEINTGTSAKEVAYKDISDASIEDRGKRRFLRLTYSGGSAVLDSADMDSPAAFEEMSTLLQQRLRQRS